MAAFTALTLPASKSALLRLASAPRTVADSVTGTPAAARERALGGGLGGRRGCGRLGLLPGGCGLRQEIRGVRVVSYFHHTLHHPDLLRGQ